MMHLDPLELDAAREEGHPHLVECAECRAAVEGLDALAGRLVRASHLGVPARVDQAVLAGLPRRRVSRRWIATAAAAVLLAALAVQVVRLPSRPDIVDAYRASLRGDASGAGAIARACVETKYLAILLGAHDQTRFAVVDLYVDAGDRPLAAWQVEVTSSAQIVGVEGSPEPPTYDPRALQGGRIVLASFTTDAKPPSGRVRVARLHVMESGRATYGVKLMAAAAPGGERIDAKVEVGGAK